MGPKIKTNSDEPPVIDILVESLAWEELEAYVRISQRYLLAEIPDSGGQYRGFYRAGTGLANTPDLGADEDAAVKAFREHLRQPIQ